MPDPSSPDERSLPAPYQSPWEALREDIPAAVADLRLRLQELWRRNREGDLSTPGFWPTDLAPLFWPVVLALMLIVVALGVIQLTLALQGTDDTPAPGIETIRTTPLPEARPLRADPEPALEASNLPGQPLAQELDPPSLRSEKAPGSLNRPNQSHRLHRHFRWTRCSACSPRLMRMSQSLKGCCWRRAPCLSATLPYWYWMQCCGRGCPQPHAEALRTCGGTCSTIRATTTSPWKMQIIVCWRGQLASVRA